jgi:transposase
MYLNNTEKFIKGKAVFCGIDIHKHFWNLCYYCDKVILEKTRIIGTAENLISHTRKQYHSARSVEFVYEAGFSGFHLYRSLRAAGFRCTVTAPNRMPSYNDKVKTDKKDSEKLARFMASGLLKAVYVPPLSVEAGRQFMRLRRSYQQKLSTLKNQISSHLRLFGIMYTGGSKWTRKHLVWLEHLEFAEPMLRRILDRYLETYGFLQGQVTSMTRQIRELSQSASYKANYDRLVSCKGIGLITAMTLLLEAHDVSRFSSAERFASYLGLTPGQHSSGEHVRLGHITREGNAHIRHVLVECAWTVIRYDASLRAKYHRIKAKGPNGKKAIVAVARTLAGRLRHCLLNEEHYQMASC